MQRRSRRRTILLATIGLILILLVVPPLRAHRAAVDRLTSARVELVRAERDLVAARQLEDASHGEQAMVREARRLGYVYPGETPWLVTRGR